MLKKINDFLAGWPMTLVGGVFLMASLAAPWLGIQLPVDPAWITVIVSGLPLLYLALWRVVHNTGISKISSALLISIAMIAAVAIGDLFAADQLVRAEAAVRIAGDETEVGEHPHGVVVPDRAPVGKVCGLGRGAGQDQQPRKHSRKQQTEKLFQDVSLLPAGKMTKRSVSP